MCRYNFTSRNSIQMICECICESLSCAMLLKKLVPSGRDDNFRVSTFAIGSI